MVNFEIPTSFKEGLEGNFALDSLVKSCISEFGEWLQENNVKFFAEYTDHSLRHVENVLRTATQLIREECSGLLTAQDIATLIISVFLHDSAMHLSIDGFLSLINDKHEDRIIGGFGDKRWKVLWLEYLAEARRFSGRKLTALFGDTKAVEYPPSNPQDMSGRDLLLIGEFLRRHHPRLAHEIARFGVPGPKEETLKLNTSPETEQIIDLAGLIARSHGMAIRDCYSYLENTYGSLKNVTQIHPIYLMALLRISDILQIDPGRAPRYVEKLRKIQSPVSQLEWELHHSIKDINFEEYPETILITARPENVRIYIKIRKLLNQIQKELDLSWTAIGEIYGYNKKFREFGLTIRRVRSNIDDIEKLQKQVGYIPCEASFEVADTDLLKLLIAPLYGDDPAIGIRELVQNSIDAVRELKAYQQNRPELQNIDLIDQDGDVVVSIDKGSDKNWWVTVSDRGIGMRLQTILDYFLKAGASLRRSDLWRKTFEDEKGSSKVLRSGRFGVGALAAFLLGDKITITTRYVEEPLENGIEFSAQIDSETIELYKRKCPVGTTVQICISESIMEALTKKDEHIVSEPDLDSGDEDDGEIEETTKAADSWDWYCLSEPKVVRAFQQETLKQDIFLPSSKEKLSYSWRRIIHPDYEDIQWTYDNKIPNLVCNGIRVTKRNALAIREELLRAEDRGSFLSTPSLSVFDPNANLPLNLERTQLAQDTFPFQKELTEDVINDFIAYLLVNAPSAIQGNWEANKHYVRINYPGYSEGHSFTQLQVSPWYIYNQEIGLYKDLWNLRQIKAKAVLAVTGYVYYKNQYSMFRSKSDYKVALPAVSCPNQQVLVNLIKTDFGDFKDSAFVVANKFGNFLKEIMVLGPNKNKLMSKIRKSPFMFFDHIGGIESAIQNGKRILFSRSNYERLMKMSADPDFGENDYLKYEKLVDPITEWQNDSWVLWKIGDCPNPYFDFKSFAEDSPDNSWPCILSEFYLRDDEADQEISIFSKIWKEIIKSPTIPLDLKLRHETLSDAYKLLAPYIEAHEYSKQEAAKSLM